MQRRLVLAALPALAWRPAQALSLTEGDANAGIRTALERGATAAVSLLGRPDGFLGNPLVKIELPGHLKDAAKLLRATGQGAKLDELVTAMNRAAEAAVPAAKPLLVKAVKDMSLEDGLKILRGGDDAATQFFAAKTREPLHAQFLPIVTQATEKVALADKYNAVAKKAGSFGLVKGDEANLQQYVTGRALDGLYRLIGEEEKKIRQDPIGTGSAILKKVFGGLGG
ncbi:DUF4197 domain-containing protein [Roseateles sp. BYS87W]|uniref:DUF4197 domain-containing protein n=1 Tax=Pelomonas baiyunensis TaxID=3299026 RepID=A0ABW7GZT9_9BURK